MPKKIAKTKARSSKRSASKAASKQVTKKVADKTLGKKATKKVAGKTSGKKASKKVDNPLIPTRKRKGMLLLNPKPMTPRQKARLIRAFQMAYEDHQRQLAEMANQPQEAFQCPE